MKRIVDVYIESISGSGDYSKLELFNDEKIELTSSVQNIQDISKVYTDFTQSFTIPASTNNNSILHHFYQSDVDVIDNGWNFNFRIRARIEIDLVPFRTGTIMLEKANIKNGSVDSYTITFYGDLVSLKDKFGETKLSDLDFTAYDIDYTATNVINRVTTDSVENLMFPLISSKRYWTYNDGTSTDIKTHKVIYCKLHIYQTNLVTSELARLNNHFAKGGLIIGDNAEPRLITELKHQGNNVVPCVKHKITEGIEMIRDYELIIDENSVDLIKELNNYCWLEKKSETPIGKYDHALDALRYAVSYQLANPNKGNYSVY